MKKTIMSKRMKHLLALLSLSLLLAVGACNTGKMTSKEGEVTEEKMAPPPLEKPEIRLLEKNPDYQPSQVPVDFIIDSAWCKGDILHLQVNYKGGCEIHDFRLIWPGMYMKSLPMKAPLFLTHRVANETCIENITEELKFDNSLLEPGSSDRLFLLLEGYKNELIYTKE